MKGCSHTVRRTAVFFPTHGRLAIGIVHVAPQVYPFCRQFLFFFLFAEVLEYDEGIALCCLHCRVVVLQDGYAGGIVVGGGGFGRCGLGEAFGEVETETVYLVFVQQELQVALHELAHQGTSWLKSWKTL